MAVVSSGCCFSPASRPSVEPASLEIVVPREVLAGQVTDQPQTLHVRRTPGTLEYRGFLIATLCSDEADFETRWSEAIEVETSIDVWIEPGYRDDPNTPCGDVPEALRRDLIVAGPRGRPSARITLRPGAHERVVLAPPTVLP
jgi:hypothetical protein